MSDANTLTANGIEKSYTQGESALPVLKGVDLHLKNAEDVCIVGSSGSGKSTLLHILGTLDRPSDGEVFFQGESLFKKNDEELARFRSLHMGFVFQFHHLLPEFSALENIMMPHCILGKPKKEARVKAKELLKQFGLSDRAEHFPSQLSGGEQQRVAIARAIINQPEILFADEPTGNLDSENSQNIQDIFFELNRRLGLNLVVVTHDKAYASKFSRCLEMNDGLLVSTSVQ